MKAMEAGAPMISVPAGVLKEFMTPNNSRTPTPPLSTAPVTPLNNNNSSSIVNNVTQANKSRTPTPTSTPSLTPSTTPIPTTMPALTSVLNNRTPSTTPIPTTPVLGSILNSRTPSLTPTIPIPTTTPALTPILNARTSSPVVPSSLDNSSITITSARKFEALFKNSEEKENNVNGEVKQSEDGKEMDQILSEDTKDFKDETNVGEAGVMVNGTAAGMKRSSDEEGGPTKPDLKKIRVFPNNDVTKRDLSMTVKEFNQHLDLASRFQKPDDGGSPGCVEIMGTVVRRDTVSVLCKERPFLERDNTNLRRRIHRLTRKELENIVMRQFSEKVLYECDMGRMKQLCEKLETTLENNRKKTAQFHKEIEDLRKVTNRLTSEHIARKGLYVAPIKIKRSVGIQAAPHIINKGIMHASGNSNAIKTICPRGTSAAPTSSVVGVVPSTSSLGSGLLPSGTLGIFTTAQTGMGRGGPVGGSPVGSLTAGMRPGQGQIMMMAPSTNNVQNLNTVQSVTRLPQQPSVGGGLVPVSQGRMVRAPMAALGTVMAPTTALVGQRPILFQGDKTGLQPVKTNGGIIDLTEEDDTGVRGQSRATAVVPKPGTLVKVPTSGTAQLLPLQQAGGMGQVVLLNNTNGGQPTTALIVSQVSAGMSLGTVSSPAVAQARIGSSVVGTGTGTGRAAVVNSITRTTTSTLPHSNLTRHPAPLPSTPVQQVAGLSKMLPPQPTLKLSHKESSIVLSWTMAKTEDHENIASYQLYAYQEGTTPPSASLWKKVGSVKALELPMACTLTQFMPGHVYHFAVRAVDIRCRLGRFSDPKSIKLDKK